MDVSTRDFVEYSTATATYTWLHGPKLNAVIFPLSKVVTDYYISPSIESFFRTSNITELVQYTLEDLIVGVLTAVITHPSQLFTTSFYKTLLYATTASQVGKIAREILGEFSKV